VDSQIAVKLHKIVGLLLREPTQMLLACTAGNVLADELALRTSM